MKKYFDRVKLISLVLWVLYKLVVPSIAFLFSYVQPNTQY